MAYLAIQMASWTAASIWSCLIAAVDESCMEYYRPDNLALCRTEVADTVLNFVQLLISTCWLAMIVHTVGLVKGRTRKEAFEISVNVLLKEGKDGVSEGNFHDGDSTIKMMPV